MASARLEQQQQAAHSPFATLVSPNPTPTATMSNPERLSGHELDALEKADVGGKPSSWGNQTFLHKSLKIAIVTENFLPKVDGVTRTLAMLLEHLQKEGHEAIVLGPESGMASYAGHEVVGTKGLPLLGVYKGLSLNFIRPRFIRKLREFQPDVIQFVDPIWLCAQVIPIVQYYMPDTPLLTSYHTNLAMYATLFGFSWLTPTMWSLQRNLHGRCKLTFCPSPSTARMLTSQGFNNVRLWPRGVNTELFRPEARDYSLRQSWSAEPDVPRLSSLSSDSLPSFTSRRSSLESSPPAYSSLVSDGKPASAQSKIVLLYVGRISWEKNLRLLVEAFRGLEKPSQDGSRPACQLVFVGDGPSRTELENLCARYELGAVFMGYRKGEELAAAYASADIFAFPSWTETFGQVVLESLASGLPVVGLRAEGVCDLVQHEKTGLLLDLDELLPVSSRPAPLPNSTEFKPLPTNPHSLVDSNSPTFPLAVSMYRALLTRLATNHPERQLMGQMAFSDASTKSWHDAMELLVDGYREIAMPPKPDHELDEKFLALSRTSTMDLDIVCDDASSEKGSKEATTTSADQRPRRLLRFGGVFKRNGSKTPRDGSMNGPMIASWLGREKRSTIVAREVGVVGASSGVTQVTPVLKGEDRDGSFAWRRIFKAVLMTYVAYKVSQWVLSVDSVKRIVA